LPNLCRTSGAASAADRTSAFTALKRANRELRERNRELESELRTKDAAIAALERVISTLSENLRDGGK
jgi:hypothetical protein